MRAMDNKELNFELNANCEKAHFSEGCSKSKNLSKPILNSTIRQKNQLEQIQKTRHVNLNKNAVGLLNKPKLTTKLNFGTHQKVFGDLTPINVNDSLLLPKVKLPIPKKYTQSCDRIATPDLHDFLDSLAPLTYVIEEPQLKLQLIEYDFDVMLNYKLLKE